MVDVNYFPSYAGIDGAASGLRDVIKASVVAASSQPAERQSDNGGCALGAQFTSFR